ncbi:MAG: glycosyltransferase family 4 protein [Saprospiraceae bacterium]|nr:glycosyltransferase family 4 protein [Saprospiraceae bacterium]
MIRVLVISEYKDFHSTRPEANTFIGLANEGMDVHVMSWPDPRLKSAFIEAGITVVDWHPEKKFDKKEIKRIRQYIVDHRIEVVHLFNGTAIVNGIQAAKKTSAKIVLYRGFIGHINWYDPSAYFKYLHPAVDAIMCNAKGVEEYLRKQLIFGKDKARTINKGHDIDWYKVEEKRDIREELGIPQESFLLVNTSNNRRMKGIPYLLKAFNQLPAYSPVHLLLIGRGMDDAKNLEIVKQGGKGDKIHFLGFQEDVLPIVADCDAFVLSSLWGESITKAVIEAMSLGVAPIITDISGNKELVVDGISGLVTPARDFKTMAKAIQKLFNDRELCEALGRNAKKHIEQNLNTKQTIAKLKALYEELTS